MAAPPHLAWDGAPGRPGRPTKTLIGVSCCGMPVLFDRAGLLGPRTSGDGGTQSPRGAGGNRGRPAYRRSSRMPWPNRRLNPRLRRQEGRRREGAGREVRVTAAPTLWTTFEAAGKLARRRPSRSSQAPDSTLSHCRDGPGTGADHRRFSSRCPGPARPQARQRESSACPRRNDHFEILTSPEFRIIPPSATKPLEIVTQPGSSRLASNSTLAQLVRLSAHSWRFEWTKEAKSHSTLAGALRDAVLKFETREGRAIVVLLRGLVLADDRTLSICDKQPLLFDRLEPRSRSVSWTRVPGALEGTEMEAEHPAAGRS